MFPPGEGVLCAWICDFCWPPADPGRGSGCGRPVCADGRLGPSRTRPVVQQPARIPRIPEDRNGTLCRGRRRRLRSASHDRRGCNGREEAGNACCEIARNTPSATDETKEDICCASAARRAARPGSRTTARIISASNCSAQTRTAHRGRACGPEGGCAATCCSARANACRAASTQASLTGASTGRGSAANTEAGDLARPGACSGA